MLTDAGASCAGAEAEREAPVGTVAADAAGRAIAGAGAETGARTGARAAEASGDFGIGTAIAGWTAGAGALGADAGWAIVADGGAEKAGAGADAAKRVRASAGAGSAADASLIARVPGAAPVCGGACVADTAAAETADTNSPMADRLPGAASRSLVGTEGAMAIAASGTAREPGEAVFIGTGPANEPLAPPSGRG